MNNKTHTKAIMSITWVKNTVFGLRLSPGLIFSITLQSSGKCSLSTWFFHSVILSLGKQRQEDPQRDISLADFSASQGYIRRPNYKQQKMVSLLSASKQEGVFSCQIWRGYNQKQWMLTDFHVTSAYLSGTKRDFTFIYIIFFFFLQLLIS